MPKRVQRKVKRGIIYKRCAKCQDYLPESEFNLRSQAPDHIQYYCKECNKLYCKEWSHK